jgi:hypothetical protein
VWFDQESIAGRLGAPAAQGARQGGPVFRLASQACLSIKTLFRRPNRATEGLIGSLMQRSGVYLPVAYHTHTSRWAASLSVKIPRDGRKGPMHGVVDSTGLKIFSDGEWKVRCHGMGERRIWRKFHLAVDEAGRDIIGIQVATADRGDGEILPELLGQIEGDIDQVSADGPYDAKDRHAAIAERDARATIPPKKGAVPWGGEHPRDGILEPIAAHGMEEWKRHGGYHRRSVAETTMFRLKQLCDRQSRPDSGARWPKLTTGRRS